MTLLPLDKPPNIAAKQAPCSPENDEANDQFFEALTYFMIIYKLAYAGLRNIASVSGVVEPPESVNPVVEPPPVRGAPPFTYYVSSCSLSSLSLVVSFVFAAPDYVGPSRERRSRQVRLEE